MLHCYGVGHVRLRQLQDQGIQTWHDALARPESIPTVVRSAVLEESQRCLAALARNDIDYFLRRLVPQDRWRILAEFRREATFFDIETTGLEYDAQITVICCWHRRELHYFVEHENLDDFLTLLDDTRLLVSFNGATFDVPRVLDGFHIPDLPCPHLDLRWPCFHRGYTGSLKAVAAHLGIHRPRDLQDADGALAVRLWQDWQQRRQEAARQTLLRYCASDVLLLAMVADRLTGAIASPDREAELWELLPEPVSERWSPEEQQPSASVDAAGVWSPPTVVSHFGSASPSKLRARVAQRS